MRCSGIKKLAYTSSSTVYGDAGTTSFSEDYGPLVPVSLYGAAKVSSEAVISAFCSLFDMQAWVYRLANVIGARLTHGVIYDFIGKLKADPARLEILGDGKQQKPYVHVSDCLNGILFGLEHSNEKFNVFNIGPSSSTSVTTIAKMVVKAMGLEQAKLEYTGGRQGWRGDVPQVRLDVSRISRLGWKPNYTSDEAVERTIKEMLSER